MFNHYYDLVLTILTKLDSDIRLNVYIGVTGLMISIIVFIADLISNNEYELEKKLILKKTKIVQTIFWCIAIFFMLVSFPLVASNYNSSENIKNAIVNCNLLYIALQLILNFFITVFMIKVYYIFKTTVNLKSNSEYFNSELNKFVEDKVSNLDKESMEASLSDKEKLEQEFKRFIKKNNEVSDTSTIEVFDEELYVPIVSNRNGIIKSYNYDSIESIINNILNTDNKQTQENDSSAKPFIIFSKGIGDRVIKNETIGYCLKEYKTYFSSFNNCIIYNRYEIYIDDELNIIHKYYFGKADDFFGATEFDETRFLLNYFLYLYDNKLDGVRIVAISRLEEYIRKIKNDSHKLMQYSNFLDSISLVAYSNDIYEEFQQINNLILYDYYLLLKIEKIDKKKVAFDFSSNYFRYNYYMVKKNDDVRYYDHLLSNLLSFICELLKKQNYEELDVVLNNVTLEHNFNINEELDEKNRLNLQFAIGIIVCYKVLFDRNEIDLSCGKKVLLRIIKWLDTFFINTHDAAQLIVNFRSIYFSNSSIQKIYHYLDLNLFDHEYESSWSSISIDEKIVLRELLAITSIYTVSKEIITSHSFSKEDRSYYEQLSKIIMDSSKTKFEEILEINFNSELYKELLNSIIEMAKTKETEYEITEKLDNNLMNEFEKLLKENLSKGLLLEDYLKKNNKIKYSKLKLKRAFGINELIPRETFFKNSNEYKYYMDLYNGIFDIIKEQEFVKTINKFSIICDTTVESYLENITNPEDYLVIANDINKSKIKYYDSISDKIIYNNHVTDLLSISEIDGIILIEKKYLPILQYFQYDESYEKGKIEGTTFYELLDCSSNEALRKEIIDSSDWEKGNIDNPDEDLKRYCRIRVFSSFRFIRVKGAKAYIFK